MATSSDRAVFRPRTSIEPHERLLTPSSLKQLHEFTRIPDGEPHDRLCRPKKPPLARRKVVLRPGEALPAVVRPEPPSIQLRGHTVSEALRTLPIMRSEPNLFSSSVGKIGLPLEATPTWLGDDYRFARLGDMIHSEISVGEMRHLRSSTSAAALRSRSLDYAREKRTSPRRGRALMLSGGAPLTPLAQRSLDNLQLQLVLKTSIA